MLARFLVLASLAAPPALDTRIETLRFHYTRLEAILVPAEYPGESHAAR